MKNPYEILGVSPSATDEEIKSAYRALTRKYHPDRYVDNPLADLAQEKMKEINEAYDAVMHDRQNHSTRASNYTDIRNLIAQRRILQAEELLDGIPSASRTAEWFYLKGQVLYQKGWLEEADRHFRQAASMDPQNVEYRAAVNRSNSHRNGSYTASSQNVSVPCDSCDICSTMLCASCCCDMMSGGMFRCCR